jgi:hypothetical protein
VRSWESMYVLSKALGLALMETWNSSFNLDLPNGLVFWNEKDQDYREPLVRSLTASVA